MEDFREFGDCINPELNPLSPKLNPLSPKNCIPQDLTPSKAVSFPCNREPFRTQLWGFGTLGDRGECLEISF